MTTAAYVLAVLVAGVALWSWLRVAWLSLEEPTLVEQMRRVWHAPVIKAKVTK